MEPVAAVLVGAGQRGHHVYGRWASHHPEQLRFVAVYDPDPARIARFTTAHPTAHPLQSYEEIATVGAEACVVASPDAHHRAAATAAISAGMHVLLEKPIAASHADCVDLERLAGTTDRVVHVAHVLRSTRFFSHVHDLVAAGDLGEVVTLAHRENVAAWHMAHSFVRGNWSRRGDSTPMIVAKCCHDFDLVSWLLPAPVVSLWSYGSLLEFRPQRAPAGATARCTDPCPVADCPYDARPVYLAMENTGWPIHVITDDMSMEGRLAALATGPYGRCAYRAGSDVVDHQVVAMRCESGASASLTMHGHSAREERTIRIDGTRRTLRGRFGSVARLELLDHRSGDVIAVDASAPGGHGGGDDGSIRAFLAAVRGDEPDPTPITEAMESHHLAFAAEESRLSGEPVAMAEFRARHPS